MCHPCRGWRIKTGRYPRDLPATFQDNPDGLGCDRNIPGELDVKEPSPLGVAPDVSGELALKVGNFQASLPAAGRPIDTPMPRAKRCRRRPTEDKGLPPDAELRTLAQVYAERQRQLWPEMAQAGFLPEPDAETLERMVEDFKLRHRTGEVPLERIRSLAKLAGKLGGAYSRYSCDNSSPTSNVDQLVNELDAAKKQLRFIPWEYIFADYSVSGLNPARQGYTSYKGVLANPQHLVETTFIDDFTRASRGELEWWKLASLSKRLHKRLIGASDGFDLDHEDWETKITIYGLVSRLFMKQLRQKVRRGMQGAIRRGTCTGKPPLGYTRIVHRNEAGAIICGPDGLPKYEYCIDPVTREHALLAWDLFTQKKWSPYRIAKHFNQIKVEGDDGWTGNGIRMLLQNEMFIGLVIRNRTHLEWDLETSKNVAESNPPEEWEMRQQPGLRLISDETWCISMGMLNAARKKCNRAGKPLSRNQRSASTLFSGTLMCGYCGKELYLGRSAGTYKVMACLDGCRGVHGCKLTTSKSVRIIEESLLGYLKEMLTESTLAELVEHANEFLAAEARKPIIDVKPLQAQLRGLQARISKLVRLVEAEPDEGLCQGYNERIKVLEKERQEAQARLHTVEAASQPVPAPLTPELAQRYLADLRAVLNLEVPAAAEAIRQITGPIQVTQERRLTGKRGATWIASFQPDLVRLMSHIGRANKYPDSITLEYLRARNWITAETVQVSVDAQPKYEKYAQQVRELRDKGVPVTTIAFGLGITPCLALEAYHFAVEGVRRKTKKPGRRTGTKVGTVPAYIAMGEQVTEMRDQNRMSFQAITQELKISLPTVKRAYEHHRQAAVRSAAERGEKLPPTPYSHLGEAKDDQIRQLLQEGVRPEAVATTVGCGKSTVWRVKQAMGLTGK